MLSNKYLGTKQADARMKEGASLAPGMLNDATLSRIRALNDIAARRGQTLAQMAIAWVLRDARVTSALIGVSRVEQLEDCVAALKGVSFDAAELAEIDMYAIDSGINLWANSSAV
jgi:L-glyceraldehyde 3-phosphate reductase